MKLRTITCNPEGYRGSDIGMASRLRWGEHVLDCITQRTPPARVTPDPFTLLNIRISEAASFAIEQFDTTDDPAIGHLRVAYPHGRHMSRCRTSEEYVRWLVEFLTLVFSSAEMLSEPLRRSCVESLQKFVEGGYKNRYRVATPALSTDRKHTAWVEVDHRADEAEGWLAIKARKGDDATLYPYFRVVPPRTLCFRWCLSPRPKWASPTQLIVPDCYGKSVFDIEQGDWISRANKLGKGVKPVYPPLDA